jgi:hypothetical protein
MLYPLSYRRPSFTALARCEDWTRIADTGGPGEIREQGQDLRLCHHRDLRPLRRVERVP